MALTSTQQRNAVSTGTALGLALCAVYSVPSAHWPLSLAFEGAWRAWDVQWKKQFPQVDADLRSGLDGSVAMTRANAKESATCLFWNRAGPEYRIYAREGFEAEKFAADEVAALIDGDVTPEGWQTLASEVLARLSH